MTSEDHKNHVRRLADSRCKAKHLDHYDSLICVGPNSSGFGPPCEDCIRETEDELEKKRDKAHGIELSSEEAARVRQKLGLG